MYKIHIWKTFARFTERLLFPVMFFSVPYSPPTNPVFWEIAARQQIYWHPSFYPIRRIVSSVWFSPFPRAPGSSKLKMCAHLSVSLCWDSRIVSLLCVCLRPLNFVFSSVDYCRLPLSEVSSPYLYKKISPQIWCLGSKWEQEQWEWTGIWKYWGARPWGLDGHEGWGEGRGLLPWVNLEAVQEEEQIWGPVKDLGFRQAVGPMPCPMDDPPIKKSAYSTRGRLWLGIQIRA